MSGIIYNFYYSKTDELVCSGTSQDLVRRGFFPTINSVHSLASRIKSGINKKYEVYIDDGQPEELEKRPS